MGMGHTQENGRKKHKESKTSESDNLVVVRTSVVIRTQGRSRWQHPVAGEEADDSIPWRKRFAEGKGWAMEKPQPLGKGVGHVLKGFHGKHEDAVTAVWTDARERTFAWAGKGKLSGPLDDLTRECVGLGRWSASRRKALPWFSFQRCNSRPLDHICKWHETFPPDFVHCWDQTCGAVWSVLPRDKKRAQRVRNLKSGCSPWRGNTLLGLITKLNFKSHVWRMGGLSPHRI